MTPNRVGSVCVSVLLLCYRHAAAADVKRAVAVLEASADATGSPSGTVTFSQIGENDVTVKVDITGLEPNSVHGFHVHQFGDDRVDEGFGGVGYHFIPLCNPIIQPDGSFDNTICIQNSKHGYPPSMTRQPGDMGNITADGTGAVDTTIVIGQSKISLSDPLKSIVGRSVVVHQDNDDGRGQWGNAGRPGARGVIAIAAPENEADTNVALGPEKQDKLICVFKNNNIAGHAFITHYPLDSAKKTSIQARITGLNAGPHSWHFHEFGDLTIEFETAGAAGEIFEGEMPVMEASRGVALFQGEFVSDQTHVFLGRSLTIHEGSASSDPTVAWGVCGLPPPKASFEDIDPSFQDYHGGGPPGVVPTDPDALTPDPSEPALVGDPANGSGSTNGALVAVVVILAVLLLVGLVALLRVQGTPLYQQPVKNGSFLPVEPPPPDMARPAPADV